MLNKHCKAKHFFLHYSIFGELVLAHLRTLFESFIKLLSLFSNHNIKCKESGWWKGEQKCFVYLLSMLVTLCICLKQYFDTRYLVFYNTSPPRMFLSLDLLWEYWIQHGANGPLYVTSCYSTWIFCRGVSGFATDCPCDVWCRGLTTCLLHVGPPFGNRILNNSWAVGLT